jgi:hypothetical protein
MQNKDKKKLLKEATIRRFQALANIGAINEMFPHQIEEEEDIEEVQTPTRDDPFGDGSGETATQKAIKAQNPTKKMKEGEHADKEEVDEGMYAKKDDEVEEGMHQPGRDDDVEEGMHDPARDDEPMDDEPMDDEPMDDMGMDMGDDAGAEAEVTVSDSEVDALRKAVEVLQTILDASGPDDDGPADDLMGDEPGDPMDAEEPEEEDMMEVDLEEEQIDEIVEAIAAKVTKRLVREAMAKKSEK